MLLSLIAAIALAQSGPQEYEVPAGHPPMGVEVPPAAAKRRAPTMESLTGAAALAVDAGVAEAAGPLGGTPATPEELMKRLDAQPDLQQRDKSYEVAVALGRLYYAHGRFPEAVKYLGQALDKAEPTRKLYYEQRKKADAAKKPIPPAATAGCMPSKESTMEELTELARTKAKAGDAASAASCARAALHPLMESEGMLAGAKFLTGDAKGALATYEEQLKLFGSNAEAIYARGALLLDSQGDSVPALQKAKLDFERYLSDFGMAPRAKQVKALLARTEEAIAAGGITKLNARLAAERGPKLAAAMTAAEAPKPSGGPPALTQEMVDAVKNTELTPEVLAGLEKLVVEGEEHLAKGRFQEALDNYKRVVPFQPQNGRAKAGMAWSLVGLGKPMAQVVWQQAALDPKAVDTLGDTLKAKGDAEGAKKVWTRLKETVPAYDLQGKLP
jgi:tetratricopeptide (TPR) repeat protein